MWMKDSMQPMGEQLREGKRLTVKFKREYNSFSSARKRCTLPWSDNYENYGGRGIKFRFKSFSDFLDELGKRPKGMSLDRINVNGHYEKGNVRWATPAQQNTNRRNCKEDKNYRFLVEYAVVVILGSETWNPNK